MRWLQTEYILKGVYLGLLVYAAQQMPTGAQVLVLMLLTLGGLVLALGVAALRKLREGYRVRGRVLSFILFLLLENPILVYAGLILGLAAGAVWLQEPEEEQWIFPTCVGGGAVLGLAFSFLEHIRDRKIRFWVSCGLAAGLCAGAIFWIQELRSHPMSGVLLLLGIPLFYLLTFAGMAEESEVEIGAMCAALGGGLWMLTQSEDIGFPLIAVAIPAIIYWIYTTRILPGLRVFKHVIRGLSYSRVGRYRPALIKLRRALQLDPKNALAREVLWSVHRDMDFDQIVREPETLALLDFDLCLERAGSLLLMDGPRPEHLQEAHRLLNLVAGQRPDMLPACEYWRAVAYTHARDYDRAAAALEAVVTPSQEGAKNPYRRSILMSAWQLALTLHSEMNRRVGKPQLEQPGRRMEAIAAVERHLATAPEDPEAWKLKRVLYADLTEAEYDAVAGEGAARDFDHAYTQQLGLALINDPARWQRGGEYLRIAARGLPTLGPALFLAIAQACNRADDPEGVWHNYQMVKRAGRVAGPKNLSADDRQDYFAVLKLLADEAVKQGNYDEAIEDYILYKEFERSGKETYRTLAGLYEKKGDAWAALHATEQGLVYDSRDADLLARKDRYYYSVMPAELRQRWESVHKYFDTAYCLQKAQAILKDYQGDLELLDWAQHLAELVQAVKPDSLVAKVTRARILLFRGEKDQAQALLEIVRTNKPEKFPSGDDEDAWYTSNKLLGTMYLHELHQPQLAVECFLAFRQSPKSGADTMFRLGQAYEELGDRVRATRCYKQVTAFESHPLAPDAHDALQRLQT
jgi:tetratricopeptide (TPR) repeat protein